jgi:hypothetical protein
MLNARELSYVQLKSVQPKNIKEYIVTVVVGENINDLKMFRELPINTIVFSGIDGLLRFITLNNSSIKTIVMDSMLDPDKIPTIARCIHSMFPHIKTVEYANESHAGFEYHLAKPFNESGRSLLETLSGE